MLFGIVIIILRLSNQFEIPGYAATMIAIMFFGALNTLGLGIVGAYTWRAYENTKHRPLAVVQSAKAFEGTTSKRVPNPLTVGNSS
jgi:hypothetical protein